MSLTVAMRACDGLVLAADSRVTQVSPVEAASEDVSEKFAQIGRDVGVMTYGLAEPGFRGIQELARRVASDRAQYGYMKAVVGVAQEIFQESWAKWESEHPEGPPGASLGFVVGGYDAPTNQLRVVSLQSQSNFEPAQVPGPCFLAGRWHLAQYLVNHLYFPEMTVELATELTVLLLTTTMGVDETVGGPMQLAQITPSRGFERIYETDMEQIRRRNEHRMGKLRRFIAVAIADCCTER